MNLFYKNLVKKLKKKREIPAEVDAETFDLLIIGILSLLLSDTDSFVKLSSSLLVSWFIFTSLSASSLSSDNKLPANQLYMTL